MPVAARHDAVVLHVLHPGITAQVVQRAQDLTPTLNAQCEQVAIFPMDGEHIYKEKEIIQ
mgnify:CR=1 FL=1